LVVAFWYVWSQLIGLMVSQVAPAGQQSAAIVEEFVSICRQDEVLGHEKSAGKELPQLTSVLLSRGASLCALMGASPSLLGSKVAGIQMLRSCLSVVLLLMGEGRSFGSNSSGIQTTLAEMGRASSAMVKAAEVIILLQRLLIL
jgi:hypothetical protein